MVARWGGEEFIIMVDGDAQTASDMAEHLRATFEKQVVQSNQDEFGFTSSFGVAQI